MEKIRKNKKERILCAMSGGVDSSVAAAILKKQGYEVLGVFLKFWSPKEKNSCYRGNTCCNDEALRSARAVCEKLKIPFYVFDVSREFKKEVVDYYIGEYDSGRTPNPCVVCNKKIKFGWLIKKAKKLGCDFIATGHYARIVYQFAETQKDEQILSFANGKKMCALLKRHKGFQWRLRPTFCHVAHLFTAKDTKKDQSYFLWQLSQNQLRHVLFPIGDYTKAEVREMARKWKLPTAEKQESQDICFVPDGDNAKFLHQYAKKLTKSGNIVDKNGNILGQHQGLINYTVGQRHGLPQLTTYNLQHTTDKNSPKPKYVIKLDVDKNQLIVGEEKDLYSNKLITKNVNWLVGKPPKFSLTYQAKIRYGAKEARCKLSVISSQLSVKFVNVQRAITIGQSVVIYNKEELMGGAVIK